VISELSKNQANLAFRAGIRGDWEGALAAFDAHHYSNTLAVDHPRADDPDEVVGNLAALGADTFAWYGVQLFTDHWDDFKLSENFESILSAEEQAGRREPYRRLAAATHVVSRRRYFLSGLTGQSEAVPLIFDRAAG
jgi:hypothetical protein